MKHIYCKNFLISRFLTTHKTAALHHFKRVADYLELGEGTWYSMREGAIEFHDGDSSPSSHDAGPVLAHFR